MPVRRWALWGVIAAVAVVAGVGAAGGAGILFQAIYKTSGGTSRTAYSKLSDAVSVKDYGAVGDGVTNDTAAFTSAIAAAGTTSTIVLPCPGTYLTTTWGSLNCGINFNAPNQVSGILPQANGGTGSIGVVSITNTGPDDNPLVVSHFPINSAGCQTTVSGLTYTRTGTVNSTFGHVESACTANQAPFSDYGLIVEGSHTNVLAAGTEDFSNAAWVKTNSSSAAPVVTTDVIYGPNFMKTGDSVTFGATVNSGDFSVICQDFTGSAASHTFSTWVRSNGSPSASTAYLMIWDGATAATSTACNYNTGPWKHCSVTKTTTVATWKACIGLDLRSYTGQSANGAIDVQLWGAQIDRFSAATTVSYPMQYTANGGAVGAALASWTNSLPSGANEWCVGVTARPMGGLSWAAIDSYPLTSGTITAANTWGIRAFTDGKIYFDVYDSTPNLKRVNATHGFANGSSHDITACDKNGTLTLYFDGTAATVTTSGVGTGIVTTQPGTIVSSGASGTTTNYAIRSLRQCRVSDGARCGPAVDRLLFLGDSLTDGAYNFSPYTQVITPWPNEVGRIISRQADNQAISGTTTANILTTWTSKRSQKEKTVVVLAGTNDVIAGTAAATTFANLKTIYDQAIADGQTVIPMTIPPCNLGATNEAIRKSVNVSILNYCATHLNQALCVDASSLLQSPTNSAQLRSDYDAGDGVHLQQNGTNRLAAQVVGMYSD